jgi:hypothetical protein
MIISGHRESPTHHFITQIISKEVTKTRRTNYTTQSLSYDFHDPALRGNSLDL